jgi:hypothetical protein
MKKDEKKRGNPKNTFLQLGHDEPWDTLKAQLLVKISNILKPTKLEFDDYGYSFTVPRIHTKLTSLDDQTSYTFMVDRALRSKDPAVNLIVEPHSARAKKVSLAPLDAVLILNLFYSRIMIVIQIKRMQVEVVIRIVIPRRIIVRRRRGN